MNATPTQASILAVDDDTRSLMALQGLLADMSLRVVTAKSGDEALRCVLRQDSAVILMDARMPGVDGFEAARLIRERSRHTPIIFLTSAYEVAPSVTRGYEAGADDYLTKPFSHRELLARIKAVVRRRAPHLGDEPVEFGDLKLDPAAHRITTANGKISLWATEFRLLHFLITHPDRVYSRGQLLDEVWGDHVFVEDRTVDVHIRRLRQALQPSGHEKWIETVRGAGYCFRATPG
jgi:two-component system phosphate regulon response regulator PhoB